jgi:hypothetical protein
MFTAPLAGSGLEMLTQQAIRLRLDAIADEVLQSPGMYHELFVRIYSQRVQRLIDTASVEEAALIRKFVVDDPDFSLDEADDSRADIELLVARSSAPLFNPAWDVQY